MLAVRAPAGDALGPRPMERARVLCVRRRVCVVPRLAEAHGRQAQRGVLCFDRLTSTHTRAKCSFDPVSSEATAWPTMYPPTRARAAAPMLQ